MDVLSDDKKLAIELLAEGVENKTTIAQRCCISRQTLYDWMNNDKFKAELDTRLRNRKVFVEKVIDSKLETAVDELIKLALTTENARVKAQCLQYIVDRGLGKPTSKHEFSTDTNQNDNVSKDVLEAEFAEVDDED